MILRLRRPSAADSRALLERSRADSLTYAPVGCALDGPVPAGLSPSRANIDLAGADAFDRAADALRTWAVHREAGLEPVADGDVAPGVEVALVARLSVGFVVAVCRVVSVIDEPDRRGFVYGTLRVHPERGEEAFVVTRTATGARFEISAASTPAHPVARLVPWAARRMQAAAIRRYLDAMSRLVEN
jgi:uncharacterized protein (UPF0548 family)